MSGIRIRDQKVMPRRSCCERDVILCNALKIRDSIKPDSISCNACCYKNVARLDDCEACYTLRFHGYSFVTHFTQVSFKGFQKLLEGGGGVAD